MRRLALTAVLLLSAAAAPALAASSLTAPLGQAVKIPLRGAISDVVVGDPKIADVTVVSPTLVYVTGKSSGSTNVILISASGATLYNGRVLVPPADNGQVTIQRGTAATAFFCAPFCEGRPGPSGAQPDAAAQAVVAMPVAAPAAPAAPVPTAPPLPTAAR